MPTTINGTTGVNLVQDGVVGLSTLASNSVNQAKVGTNTLAGTGPAFSARMTTNQNVATGTTTKLVFNAEDYDTNSNFDPTTNYRFTPTVAGYYQLSTGAFASVGTSSRFGIVIYKNGSEAGWNFNGGVTSNGGGSTTLSSLFYANGTTDYFEVYVDQNSGGTVTINSSAVLTWFRGFLARSA